MDQSKLIQQSKQILNLISGNIQLAYFVYSLLSYICVCVCVSLSLVFPGYHIFFFTLINFNISRIIKTAKAQNFSFRLKKKKENKIKYFCPIFPHFEKKNKKKKQKLCLNKLFHDVTQRFSDLCLTTPPDFPVHCDQRQFQYSVLVHRF